MRDVEDRTRHLAERRAGVLERDVDDLGPAQRHHPPERPGRRKIGGRHAEPRPEHSVGRARRSSRWMWPSTVTRASKPVSCSSRGAIAAETPPSRSNPNASSWAATCAPGGGSTPSATTTTEYRSPRSARERSRLATTSRSYGSSGIRIASAPPAIPAYNAIHPACGPSPRAPSRGRGLGGGVIRSIASVAICTAVSNPNVTSVPARSLSIVFGTPTIVIASSTRRGAVLSVPSPPTTTSESIHSRARVSAATGALAMDVWVAPRRAEDRPAPLQDPPHGGAIEPAHPALHEAVPAVPAADDLGPVPLRRPGDHAADDGIEARTVPARRKEAEALASVEEHRLAAHVTHLRAVLLGS